MLLKALIGTSVGVLVGLTGLGSGVLLLPILIFGLGVPPIVAVGSDAVFGALTKLGAGCLHCRQHTVHWRLVLLLLLGSIPGALVGVSLLAHLRIVYGDGVNNILRYVIGLLLVLIPVVLLLQGTYSRSPLTIRQLIPASWTASVVGLFAGFLVGISSVGSGTVVLVLLLLLIQCSPAALVGSDIVHAVILTGFTGFLYLRLGTVDFGLVMALLVGSVPGALIGVRLSTRLPNAWLKRVLCLALLATGVKMLLV